VESKWPYWACVFDFELRCETKEELASGAGGADVPARRLQAPARRLIISVLKVNHLEFKYQSRLLAQAPSSDAATFLTDPTRPASMLAIR